VLILAREFASNLATPIYIADSDEVLVYFNEPAENIAGQSFAETGEIPVREFTDMLAPRAIDGHPLERDDLPGRIAFAERRPAHGTLCVTGLDGTRREIATTAFPLFGPDEEFHGIMVIFWEQG
jgi:PAS domain-containing protein